MYLPTRLIEKATPEWRPIQWSLGIETIGLTLCAIYLGRGNGWLRQAAFPICFFFVALPWPTPIEQPVIQSLTRINSAIVVELLGWTSIPAIQHGNLIEVSTGTVGVSQACSGIRSFQTSLMISLFFGEFYRMGVVRRLLLIPAGFTLAMVFNVCRMDFLTTIASKKGIVAIAEYHDPAGILITVVCTAGLWALALLFSKCPKAESRKQKPEVDIPISESLPSEPPPFALPSPISAFQFSKCPLFEFSLFLLLWLLAVDAGSELWYRGFESHLATSPKWSVVFPIDDPSFKSIPIDWDTKYLLRYDDAKQVQWNDSDGSRWQVFYCNWLPGRIAGYLAKRHTPEVCLPAMGLKLLSGPELIITKINGVTLPIRSYVFRGEEGLLYVFHCRWEAGVNAEAYVKHESARFNLIRGIWAGRGNQGEKVLEIVISGCENAGQAKEDLLRRLPGMIKVELLRQNANAQ
jgi:exosortase